MTEDLQQLLQRWKEGYHLLLESSEQLLRNFDTFTPEATAALVAQRQEIIYGFQNIDASLKEELANGAVQRRYQPLLDEFAGFQKSATERILELDSIVIALATERMGAIRTEMATMGKRRHALTAYEVHGR